jgi:hypothetical protein
MFQQVIWEPLYGYSGIYEVNNFGEIRTFNRRDKRKLKQQVRAGYGHKYVIITNKDKIRKKKYVHVAVLESFICPRPLGQEGRHIDGNPANNNLFNLRWGTHKDNMQDSILHGTFFYAGKKGEAHVNAKLKEKDVIEIKALFGDISLTNRMIGDKYGVNFTTISKIRTGKNWSHLK